MKYAKLTKEQFEELNEEFAVFLAAQSIDEKEWTKIKKDKPEIKWLTETSRTFLESGYLTGNTTPEERIHGNWPGEIPTVYRWAYDYSNPAYDEDFMMQNIPDEGVKEELFEVSGIKVKKSAKKPKPEAATLFILIKNWLKPNTI